MITKIELSGYCRDQKYHSIDSSPTGYTLMEYADKVVQFKKAFSPPYTVSATVDGVRFEF